jgi:hypothetical protein
MSDPAENCAPFAGELESAADQAIAACGGDAREALKALIVANDFLEAHVAKLQAAVSTGYARGRIDVPQDCKEMAELVGTEMAEVTYYVALPFVAADDGIAPGKRSSASIPMRR